VQENQEKIFEIKITLICVLTKICENKLIFTKISN